MNEIVPEQSVYKIAQDVIDRRSKSFVEAALVLARHVLEEKGPLAKSQEHCSKLIDEVATLKLLIEGIAKASPDDRAGVIRAAQEMISQR